MTARGDSLGCSRNLGSNYYAGLTHQLMIDLDADDAAKVSGFHSLGVGKAGGELLRGSPSLSGASVLSASRLEPLAPFPLPIAGQVLTFRTRARLSFAPPTRRMPLGRYQDILRAGSRRKGQPPVLTSPNPLSTLQKQFACARLSRPCLPGSRPDVSATLTTMAFGHSSLRWLGISDLIAEPEGPSFISRTVTYRRLDRRCS